MSLNSSGSLVDSSSSDSSSLMSSGASLDSKASPTPFVEKIPDSSSSSADQSPQPILPPNPDPKSLNANSIPDQTLNCNDLSTLSKKLLATSPVILDPSTDLSRRPNSVGDCVESLTKEPKKKIEEEIPTKKVESKKQAKEGNQSTNVPATTTGQANPPAPADPIESIGTSGLYVWSEVIDEATNKIQNCIFLPEPIVTDILCNEYCDFVFPCLIGLPQNTALTTQWINKLPELFKPGCYLVCAHSDVKPDKYPLAVYQYSTTVTLDRMQSNLMFYMRCANAAERNFQVREFINQVDDLDTIKGYTYPHYISDNMFNKVISRSKSKLDLNGKSVVVSDKQIDPYEQELLKKTGAKRVMKRYCDLIELHYRFLPNLDHLKRSFVGEKQPESKCFASQRFNFFMSNDSFAVIVDQNSETILLDHDPTNKPYLRLIRPGAYLTIEGTPRYTNLSQAKTTYLTRYVFLCRITCFPLVIVQEGVKAFDVYYNNDGLDFTYIDNVNPTYLIHLDWYQLQIDLKIDREPRSFKGHIMRFNEIPDTLSSFKLTALNYDFDFASKLNIIDLHEAELKLDRGENFDQNFILLFSLQQVSYNYINYLNGQLEVIWNLYFKISSEHLQDSIWTEQDNPLYLYMKSFTCVYNWSQKSVKSPIVELTGCQVTLSDVDVGQIDLGKAHWSLKQFDQLLQLYLNKIFPYQNSIKQWLLSETRKVDTNYKPMLRPTSVTEKLIYRNNFYSQKASSTVKPVDNQINYTKQTTI